MAQVLSYPNVARSEPSSWLTRVQQSIADYRLYRRTLDELASLSDRDLRDLGLSRFAIRQVAYDSVYGNN